MKVQFAPEGMRIRVDQAEFRRLRDGATLSLDIAGHWRMDVQCAAVGAVERADDRLAVRLPRESVEELAARLPARDGIAFRAPGEGDGIDVAFEVDLLDGRPRRPR
jgi:hypothetical protein